MTNSEREDLIIRLLGEGKNFKEIAKIAHVSFSEITSIRKRMRGDTIGVDNRFQAYEMFNGGKKPIDVALALRIDNNQTIGYWKEYLQLKREYELLEIRKDLKNQFSSFKNLYKLMRSKNYTIDELKKALDICRKKEREEISLVCLHDEIENTRQERDDLGREVKELEERNQILSKINTIETIRRIRLLKVRYMDGEQIDVEKGDNTSVFVPRYPIKFFNDDAY